MKPFETLPFTLDPTSLSVNSLINIAGRVPLQALDWPMLNQRGIRIWLRRDDLISDTYSGNKLYKLFFNVLSAIEKGQETLLSFGGIWSNHLYALAALGAELRIGTIGVLRAHEGQALTPTLEDVVSQGMRLCYLDRHNYGLKNLRALPADIRKGIDQSDIAVIPEGGANIEGVYGCQVLGQAIAAQMGDAPYTLCSAVATGTTLAGLVSASPAHCKHLAISVLKGADRVSGQVIDFLEHPAIARYIKAADHRDDAFHVDSNFHQGGYAKTTPALMDFIHSFERDHGVLLDPVYTGKLLFAVSCLAERGYWPEGSRLVVIHSGGLQGRRGFSAT